MTSAITNPNETPRQRRGRVFAELGQRFTGGFTTDRAMEDVEILDRMGIETVDLIAAGERLKITRTKTTFPQLQEILARCNEARSERLLAQREEAEGPDAKGRVMTPEEQEIGRGYLVAARAGYYWCPVCREFGPHCKQHEEAGWRSPRDSQVLDILAGIESGEIPPLRQRTVGGRNAVKPEPGSPLANAIAYVDEQRRKREASGESKPRKPDFAPISSAIDDELGGLF